VHYKNVCLPSEITATAFAKDAEWTLNTAHTAIDVAAQMETKKYAFCKSQILYENWAPNNHSGTLATWTDFSKLFDAD